MRTFRGLACSLVCAALALPAIEGCRTYDWRGKGYGEQAQSWTKDLRPPADESQFSGVDAKARDIERSLGVR